MRLSVLFESIPAIPYSLFACGVLAVSAVNIQADEGPQGTDQTIDEIIVVANYSLRENKVDSGVNLEVNTIQRSPELVQDVMRLVRVIPSVNGHEGSALVNIRGGRETEVAVEMDGHIVRDPYHLPNLSTTFGAIDPYLLDNAHLYLGNFQVDTGNISSGVIGFDTRRPSDNSYSIGMDFFSLLLRQEQSREDFHMLTSYRKGNLGLIQYALDSEEDEGEKFEPNFSDFFNKIEFDLYNTKIIWNVLSTNSDEYYKDDDESFDGKTKALQTWLNIENRWSDELKSETVLSLWEKSIDRSGFDNGFFLDDLDTSIEHHDEFSDIGIKQQWNFLSDWNHYFSAGFEYFRHKADYSYVNTVGFLTLQRDFKQSFSGNSYALYLSDKFDLLDGNYMEFGLRWDGQSYVNDNRTQISPRINIMVPLNEHVIRVALGRYYQAQHLSELPVRETRLVDEENLVFVKPLKLDQASASYEVPVTGSELASLLKIEVYGKQYHDLLPYIYNFKGPFPDSFFHEAATDRRGGYFPGDSAKAYGMEVSYNGEHGRLSWQSSYVYSKINYEYQGNSSIRPWDMPHSLKANLNFMFNERWDVSWSVNYHSGLPYPELEAIEQPDGSFQFRTPAGDDFYNARYDSYMNNSMRINYRKRWPLVEFMAYMGVANFLDNENPNQVDYRLREDAQGRINLEAQPEGLINASVIHFGFTLTL